MEDILLAKIESIYKEYKDLDVIIQEKRKSLEEKRLKLREDTNGSDLQEKVDFYQQVNVDLILFTNDLKIKFDKLFFLIDLFKDLLYEGLPKEIVDFYNLYKPYSPSEIFILKDGNLIEKEEGSLDKAREEFIKNNDFIKQLTGN